MDLLSMPQPFTAVDADTAGFTPGLLAGLLRAAVVRRVVQGVYVDARIPDSLQLRAAALSRVVPDGTLVCRGSAAWLYGVDVMPMTRHPAIPLVEVMVPANVSVPERPGCRAFSGQIERRDVE